MPACIICQEHIFPFSRPNCKFIDSSSTRMLCPDCTLLLNQKCEYVRNELVKLGESCLETAHAYDVGARPSTPPHPSVFF